MVRKDVGSVWTLSAIGLPARSEFKAVELILMAPGGQQSRVPVETNLPKFRRSSVIPKLLARELYYSLQLLWVASSDFLFETSA